MLLQSNLVRASMTMRMKSQVFSNFRYSRMFNR